MNKKYVSRILNEDYENTVKNLIQLKQTLNRSTKISELSETIVLYLSSCFSSIATAVIWIDKPKIVNIFLFASTTCFAAHLGILGISRFLEKQTQETEHDLENVYNSINCSEKK